MLALSLVRRNYCFVNSGAVLLCSLFLPLRAHAIGNGELVNLVNAGNKLCADNDYGNPSNGNPIIQYSCNSGNRNQEWTLTANANGAYSFVNILTGSCVDVPGASAAAGTKLQEYTCNGTGAQSFNIVSTGPNTTKLVNTNSGLCIDVPYGSVSLGLQLQQWYCNGTSAQDFVVSSLAGSPVRSAYREPWNQPFNNASVWNTPIGSGAQWSELSDPGTAQMVGVNGVINAAQWGMPIYVGRASDPVITVYRSTDDPNFPTPSETLHVPLNAVPANGTDRHMTFIDVTQPKLWTSYVACSLNNAVNVAGGVTCGLGTVSNSCGNGVNDLIAGTSEMDWGIGTIRDWELSAGRIQHVLRYSVSPDVAKSPTNAGNGYYNPDGSALSGLAWPASVEDYWGPRDYSGNLLFGSTIGIPASVDINQLGLSKAGLVLAAALQQFGAIMRDTGGANQLTFYAEPVSASNGNSGTLSQMAQDVPKIMPVLRRLINQGPGSIGGGGAPLYPAPAQLDPAACSGTN